MPQGTVPSRQPRSRTSSTVSAGVCAAELLGVVSGRLGSMDLYELRDPVAVLIVARGAISLRMIRREIELVAQFAADHPQGWCYVGDVRQVRLLNPLNLVARC